MLPLPGWKYLSGPMQYSCLTLAYKQAAEAVQNVQAVQSVNHLNDLNDLNQLVSANCLLAQGNGLFLLA
jgi:hypothetical protein